MVHQIQINQVILLKSLDIMVKVLYNEQVR